MTGCSRKEDPRLAAKYPLCPWPCSGVKRYIFVISVGLRGTCCRWAQNEMSDSHPQAAKLSRLLETWSFQHYYSIQHLLSFEQFNANTTLLYCLFDWKNALTNRRKEVLCIMTFYKVNNGGSFSKQLLIYDCGGHRATTAFDWSHVFVQRMNHLLSSFV